MDATPLTVLMTVYNGLPYLPDAVGSILAQQGAAFECLVIDDASVDGSSEWLSAQRDPRLRVARNPENLGQTTSLNRGLELARGAYVARLDQDDLCLPGRLQHQAEFLDAHPDVAVVGTLMRAMDADGRLLRRHFGREVATDGEAAGLLLQGLTPVQHPSVMYRRAAIMAAGGYEAAFVGAADYELWVRVVLRGGRMRALPRPFSRYRVHAGQQSTQRAAAHHARWHAAHERLVAACGADGDAPAVSRLLRLDHAWWDRQSRSALIRAFEALERMVALLPQRLGLAEPDAAIAARMVRGRVGWAPQVSLRLRRWPEAFVAPLVAAASPVLTAKRWADRCWPQRVPQAEDAPAAEPLAYAGR